MRHKWQDNMNLYENQRWNQVLQKEKHVLLRTQHPSLRHLCRIKEWNVLTTTILWLTDVISHGGDWDTVRECQMMVTTKKPFKCWSQSSFYETLPEKLVYQNLPAHWSSLPYISECPLLDTWHCGEITSVNTLGSDPLIFREHDGSCNRSPTGVVLAKRK